MLLCHSGGPGSNPGQRVSSFTMSFRSPYFNFVEPGRRATNPTPKVMKKTDKGVKMSYAPPGAGMEKLIILYCNFYFTVEGMR